MKRFFSISNMLVLSIALLSLGGLRAQQGTPVTLEQLQGLAKQYYPALKQKDSYASILDNKVNALNANYLPQISLTGQATYQSEVTKFNFSFPGVTIVQPKPDQYSVGLEVRQNILDYGTINTQKEIERSNTAVQVQQIEIEFAKVKERINQLFGNVCLQQENLKILDLRIAELDAKRKKAQSAVANGAALQSSYLTLESEYLSTEQKIAEINSNLTVWYKTLTLLTGKELDSNYVFVGDEESVVLQRDNLRPEYRLFNLQSTTLQFRERMLYRSNLPKLYAFARGYVGRPGFNFLNNSFRPYGIVGLGLSWNLSNYYTISKEVSNLHLNNALIESQKKTFDLNLQASLIQQQEEINKLEQMLKMDAQIVEAKTAIRKASSSQLDNGVITSADYITDLNGENQAQFNLKLHEIQLMMAKQNYNTALGY